MRIEEKIEESNTQFETLSKAINDAIWDWNIHDRSVQWNHGLFAIYGYDSSTEPHNYDLWAANIHPDDKLSVLNGIEESLRQQRQNWNSIYRYKCQNGMY